ncbi:hypothetical protein V1504DRAFT_456311 [Lipomyces starkeyi]
MLIGMRMISTLVLLPSSMVQLVNSQRSFHSAYNDHLVWFMQCRIDPLTKKVVAHPPPTTTSMPHVKIDFFPYLQVRNSFLTSSRTRINCHSTRCGRMH